MDASCKYSLNEVVGSAWVQTSEKLLRASLMFSDQVSVTTPGSGIRIVLKNNPSVPQSVFTIGFHNHG